MTVADLSPGSDVIDRETGETYPIVDRDAEYGVVYTPGVSGGLISMDEAALQEDIADGLLVVT